MASTNSTDIGLVTRSSKPLSDEIDADTITNVFTATTMSEDSRRAGLPMTEDMADTSPVGVAIDLSSQEIISAPISGEDIKDSAVPLPQVSVLNNEGILSSWWFVYSDSIREKKPYHGMVGNKGDQQPLQQNQTAAAPSMSPQTPKPAFPPSSFGQPAFGKPSTPSFGAPSALGQKQPTFGTPSILNNSQGTGFGAAGGTAFGSSTPLGGKPTAPAFGSPSTLGQRAPAFGQSTPLGKPNASPSFGQSSALRQQNNTTPNSSLFGSGGGGGGGFSSFAKAGGFTLTPPQPSGGSAFSKVNGDNPFAKAGQPMFQSPSSTPVSTGNFGLGNGGFSLGTGFKKDDSGEMDEDKPEDGKGALSMGSTFGNALNLNQSPQSKTPQAKSIFETQTPQPETKSLFSTAPSFPAPSAKPFGSSLEPSPAFKEAKQSTSSEEKEPVKEPVPKSTTDGLSSPPSMPNESSISDSTVKVEAPSDTDSTPMPTLIEPPLPPEPTSKAAYAPGDTSASSSSVSKSSYDDAPLPPDFVPAKKKEQEKPQEVAEPLPEQSEGEGADFEDSGEDVTNDVSPVDDTNEQIRSLKTSTESSFEGASEKTPNGDISPKLPTHPQQQRSSKQLFGEITQPLFPPPQIQDTRVRGTPRSPSPIRSALKSDGLRSTSAPSPGQALANRRVTLEKSRLANQVNAPSDEEEKENTQGQRLPDENQDLSEDDEDEQLRSDLARPISPAPTLDPYVSHRDYTGESLKPGIPGQIEKLYRDINSMIDILGMNSRSLSSFLLYQDNAKESDYKNWMSILQGDTPGDIVNEKLSMAEVGKLKESLNVLERDLQRGIAESAQEKLEQLHKLFSKDLMTLRGQFASFRKSIDMHTDAIAVASAPLSAEQATLQQDLRKASGEVQSKIADLEREISILRARIADSSKTESDTQSRKATTRPTVEAVTSTISTMTNMAEKKSGDIDVLEAQMKKLGLDIDLSASRSREGSPFATPEPKRRSRFPMTPGSHSSIDGGFRSSYHTPESSGLRQKFRSSLLGSSSGGANNTTDAVLFDDAPRWKAKAARRKEIIGHVRTALSNRKVDVRNMD